MGYGGACPSGLARPIGIVIGGGLALAVKPAVAGSIPGTVLGMSGRETIGRAGTLGGGFFEVVAITGGGGALNTIVEGGTEGGGALNTMVEGGEAKASLEIQPHGRSVCIKCRSWWMLDGHWLRDSSAVRCNKDCRY